MIVWNRAALERSGIDASTLRLASVVSRPPISTTVQPVETTEAQIAKYVAMHEQSRRPGKRPA